MVCLPLIQLQELEELNLKKNGFAVASNRRSKKPDDERWKLSRATQLEDDLMKEVCVTAATSFLGVAIINRFLSGGYTVRAILRSQREAETLKELQNSGEILATSNKVAIVPVMANLTEAGSLLEALDGCHGVLHTGEVADQCGLSGYTKSMAEIEERITENVLDACSRTASVRKCLVTSSLVACLWRNDSDEPCSIIDHFTWSDESLCYSNKLWYALGKLRSEKTAWRIAEEKRIILATICPALLIGPDFHKRNSSATFAYLKGAREMFGRGLLATVDVRRVADAHFFVYEAMNKAAHGRYICYDQILGREGVERLAGQIAMRPGTLCDEDNIKVKRGRLSNKKLCTLEQLRLPCCDQK